MALKARSKRIRRLSLTPLIDVIFLLLLFFMLTSTFTRFAEIPLAGAAVGGVASDMPPLFLQLRDERISLNGEELTLESLPTRLANEGRRQLLVAIANDQVTTQRLVDLLVVLAPISDISVKVLR